MFPHDRVVATASGPRVFPGVSAPLPAILQWFIVGLFAGWLTRRRSAIVRLLLAGVLVAVVGWLVRVVLFRVLGYEAAFP
jgi:hypothetical protein